ncbi:hypothetical protein [Bacillus sp. FJAT-22090]|uniref:hypothetical protein n=1 Tax=Bacillus sp. FJAT-22090 TaxID=1581038 RepID=UPI0016430646|nr:hypothetical protein [Bacillus sp. FJAT-22090]
MKTNHLISYAIVFLLGFSILFPVKSLASWAYAFVVWDGYVYVMTNEVVNNVDKKIGHVTKYSDREGTYSGNFSNTYPKGTRYYSIKEISTDEAIAVEVDTGNYLKAKRDGEYAGVKNNVFSMSFTSIFAWIFILFAVVFLCIHLNGKRRN